MNKPKELSPPTTADGRTIQTYIDETPTWLDGTKMSYTPMTAMQWRIWSLAAAGKFLGGMVIFLTGVALPLITKEFELNVFYIGMAAAASPAGIFVGASLLGGQSDHFGRKTMFIVEMVIFIFFLALVSITGSYFWLIVSLFGIGLSLGCDYPTAHVIISETVPSRSRGKLVLSAFAFQALGDLVGTFLGYLILYNNPEVRAWRWMYATAILPALLVMIGRLFIIESPQWLLSRNRIAEAKKAMQHLLKRDPPYPTNIQLIDPYTGTPGPISKPKLHSYKELFSRKNRRATILASVPWFLQDLGTYGIGIFTPTILATVIGHEIQNPHNLSAVIHNDIIAAKGTAFIDVMLIVGFLFAVLLTDKVGRIPLQIFGFIGCAVGLFIASQSVEQEGTLAIFIIFIGFMLFNFMNNLGPNAQTYLIAGEVFPTDVRGRGAGFAASFGKMGAVMTTFFFPILLGDIGITPLLYILVGTSLLSALITWLFRIETKNVNLERIAENR